jgi:hypothetical protein
MMNLGTFFLAATSGLSAISLLWLIPIAAVIYLDIKLVNWSIYKEGWIKFLAVTFSLIISLGAVAWGAWSVFNDFSLALLFVGVGGVILFLFSLRSALTDKEDLKHGR